MLTAKVIYHNDRPAFHLYLLSERRNTLMSTLPPQILKKYFQQELFHLENALVVNVFSADRLMETFANEVLNCQGMHPYFYSDSFPKKSLNTNLAEQVIELQDSFSLFPGMCVSQTINPIEFYYLSQRFLMYQKHIFKTGKPITSEAFESKYLTDSLALKCFQASANKSDTFLEMDDESCPYVIVVGQDKELKMLISV